MFFLFPLTFFIADLVSLWVCFNVLDSVFVYPTVLLTTMKPFKVNLKTSVRTSRQSVALTGRTMHQGFLCIFNLFLNLFGSFSGRSHIFLMLSILKTVSTLI